MRPSCCRRSRRVSCTSMVFASSNPAWPRPMRRPPPEPVYTPLDKTSAGHEDDIHSLFEELSGALGQPTELRVLRAANEDRQVPALDIPELPEAAIEHAVKVPAAVDRA